MKNLRDSEEVLRGQLLGFTKVMENEEVLAFKTGKSMMFAGPLSQDAGTNKATGVTFVAAEVDDLVRKLKEQGVAFEHYYCRTCRGKAMFTSPEP